MVDILVNALYGIVGGVAYGLTGFFKAKTEKFDVMKFGTTLVVGAISGLVVGFTGMTVDAASLAVSSAGITVMVENVFKRFTKK